MTDKQAAWLRKLRDEGPQPRPRYGAANCVRLFRKGFLRWADDLPEGDQMTRQAIANAIRSEATK